MTNPQASELLHKTLDQLDFDLKVITLSNQDHILCEMHRIDEHKVLLKNPLRASSFFTSNGRATSVGRLNPFSNDPFIEVNSDTFFSITEMSESTMKDYREMVQNMERDDQEEQVIEQRDSFLITGNATSH